MDKGNKGREGWRKKEGRDIMSGSRGPPSLLSRASKMSLGPRGKEPGSPLGCRVYAYITTLGEVSLLRLTRAVASLGILYGSTISTATFINSSQPGEYWTPVSQMELESTRPHYKEEFP